MARARRVSLPGGPIEGLIKDAQGALRGASAKALLNARPLKARLFCGPLWTFHHVPLKAIIRAQAVITVAEAIHLKHTRCSRNMPVSRMVAAEIVGEAPDCRHGTSLGLIWLTTGVSHETILISLECGKKYWAVGMLVMAKSVDSIATRPLWVPNNPLSRAVVTLTKVMFRSVRVICKATSSSFGKEFIGTDGQMQNIVGGNSLPICVNDIIWPWRDKCSNFAAETAAGLGICAWGDFVLLLDRDLDLVIDLLG